jgi:hypothetical protein
VELSDDGATDDDPKDVLAVELSVGLEELFVGIAVEAELDDGAVVEVARVDD